MGLVMLVWPVRDIQGAESGNRIAFVRDAETENSIQQYAKPLFIAAGLNPGSVRVHLILDKKLNAFVTNGQNIYIHTGLLSTAEQVGQVIGVIAHETGHIAGGHLIRAAQAIDDAKKMDLISAVLGIGASILAQDPSIAIASTVAGPQLGIRSFMQFSRTQESSADHAALKYLENTGQSAQGLFDFMKIIENQELLSASRQDPYLRTHPLSRQRLEAIEEHLRSSAYTNTAYPQELVIQHNRIRAKLTAYTSPLALVLQLYPHSDQSVWARYARAFAYYRLPDLKTGLEMINELLSDFPTDPYFHEMKAQMLFENRHGYDAIDSYQKAISYMEPSDLLFLELGQAQLSSDDDSLLPSAEANLQRSLDLFPDSAFAWRQLGIIFGRQGKMGHYHLAMGEEALLKNRIDEAIDHASRAEKLFATGTKEWLQAQDISIAAGNRK